jgi:hypothetical protein
MHVPVTAKFSKEFYDKLGHEVADEIVDWFNKADDTYRSDLRHVNELNFARFDARLEQRFAEQDAKWEQRFAELRVEIAQQKSSLIKWMFAFWAPTMVAVIGLLLR